MNIFQNMSLVEKETEVDERVAEALTKEFYPVVKSSEEYREKKNMILQITDKLREKVVEDMKELDKKEQKEEE